MAKYTNNLGLKKPEGVDHVLVNDLNGNFEIIDEAIASGSMAKGLKPSGLYATYDELIEAIVNPEIGTTYLVGESAPYELYTWTGSEWVLAGTTAPVRGVDYWTEEDVRAINEEVAKATKKINDMTVAAQSGEEAKAEISEIDGAKHIDFTLPKGDKGDKGDQGEQGEQGEQGIQGETGLTPNITFEVSTGAAGSDVQVAQSGTVENPIVHLTIPRGNPGQNGSGSGTVTSVNGVEPDASGNVTIETGDPNAVKSVNGITPDENGNVQIQTGSGGADVEYYNSTPSALGEASSGSSDLVARGDHVHPMPSPEEIGALPNTHTAAVFFEATLTSGGWNEHSSYSTATQYVTVEGLRETDNPVIDIDARRGISKAIIDAWTRVASISTYDDLLIATSLDGAIDESIPIRLMCVR